MDSTQPFTRRSFIRWSAVVGAGAALAGCAEPGLDPNAKRTAKPEREQAPILPSEDLMREHGLLGRMLLIYEAAARELAPGGKGPEAVLAIRETTEMVRKFVQDYHEKLEEEFVFPAVRVAGLTGNLPDVLQIQHGAGRKLITRIGVAVHGAEKPLEPAAVQRDLAAFARMYRPHKAREDTVLFPAFRSLYTAREFDALGEKFEGRETKQLGPEGFEKMVVRVGQIEQSLGIEDLRQFTPAPG